MNVSLGPQMESFVENLVKSGNYQSNSEVLRVALRMLQERETLWQMRLDEMKRDVRVGLDQASRGEVGPWDVGEIRKEGKKLLAGKRKKGR